MEKPILVCSLLVHAAKMDENYTEKEKSIILKSLSEIYKSKKKDEIEKILKQAEIKEAEANQILEFTKEIKKHDEEFKYKIIEILDIKQIFMCDPDYNIIEIIEKNSIN